MAGRKRVGAKRTSEAVRQLNDWVKSAIHLMLIVSAEPFSVFHTGHLQKLDHDDVYYVEPNEGGGVFEFSPSDCRPAIHRTEAYTLVSFSKGEIGLKLMENFADAKRETAEAPSEGLAQAKASES